MALIDKYIANKQRAFIDAINDPVFQNFIDPNDIETVSFDFGNGTQGQAQALKKTSVKAVIKRILDKARLVGVDLLHWICSPAEFDLCYKLIKSPSGVVIKELNDFLSSRFGQATTAALSVVAEFGSLVNVAAVGQFVAILVVLGIVQKEFAMLCRCPDD